MIKLIAFDLIGVLIRELDVNLSEDEEKLERLFGPNKSDQEYLDNASKVVNNPTLNKCNNIISKLYEVKEPDIFKKIKEKYNVKIIIATNHISLIRDFINKTFDMNYIDDLVISAEINEIKPNRGFYYYILDKYNIKPEELLFLDDSKTNIEGASRLGINTITVDKDMDITSEVLYYLSKEES